MERRILPQGEERTVFSKIRTVNTEIVDKIAKRTTYGAEIGRPISSPMILDGPLSHQFSNGLEYCDIPIAEVTVPARSRGSAWRDIRSISPSEIVTMAK